MKLWEKNISTSELVDTFTVGRDRDLDLQLAGVDILGSLAHAQMLQTIGLLSVNELQQVRSALIKMYRKVEQGLFEMDPSVEDIHSQVELTLTSMIGDAGKKIHSGRSRNDQILVDLKLFFRSEIEKIVVKTESLFSTLIKLSNQNKATLLPGYTHLQIAMPSSFGLWFGAFAESLVDDLEMLLAAWNICNKNPLGSAAGYGSSFPLNRELTTRLLGFEDLNYNVVYAQMGRGKTERILAQALSSIAATLSKFAMDVCLYASQNFGFISFPPELTTGSSIMPHKKNPDVFELIRSRSNKIQALPNEIAFMITNLPSGYHRDLQLLKESLFPALTSLQECLDMTSFMLNHIEIKKNILEDPKYDYLFSVEVVNKEVMQGVPFREAYKRIGIAIDEGRYTPIKTVNHTHAGSIGNLCNDAIETAFNRILQKFQFDTVRSALRALTEDN